MSSSTPRRALLTLVAGAVLGVGSPALAHPALVPDEVPLGGGTTELVLPHGCARQGVVPEDWTGLPTDEVVLRSTDDRVTLSALPAAGWTVFATADGDPGWRHDGEGHDGVVRLPVAVAAASMAALDVEVFQGCDDVAFRWVAGADATPAARLGVGMAPAATAHDGMAMHATAGDGLAGAGAASGVAATLGVGLLALAAAGVARDRRRGQPPRSLRARRSAR